MLGQKSLGYPAMHVSFCMLHAGVPGLSTCKGIRGGRHTGGRSNGAGQKMSGIRQVSSNRACCVVVQVYQDTTPARTYEERDGLMVLGNRFIAAAPWVLHASECSWMYAHLLWHGSWSVTYTCCPSRPWVLNVSGVQLSAGAAIKCCYALHTCSNVLHVLVCLQLIGPIGGAVASTHQQRSVYRS
jgi:hypothetical protein